MQESKFFWWRRQFLGNWSGTSLFQLLTCFWFDTSRLLFLLIRRLVLSSSKQFLHVFTWCLIWIKWFKVAYFWWCRWKTWHSSSVKLVWQTTRLSHSLAPLWLLLLQFTLLVPLWDGALYGLRLLGITVATQKMSLCKCINNFCIYILRCWFVVVYISIGNARIYWGRCIRVWVKASWKQWGGSTRIRRGEQCLCFLQQKTFFSEPELCFVLTKDRDDFCFFKDHFNFCDLLRVI